MRYAYHLRAGVVDVSLQYDVTVDVAGWAVGQRWILVGAFDCSCRRGSITWQLQGDAVVVWYGVSVNESDKNIVLQCSVTEQEKQQMWKCIMD